MVTGLGIQKANGFLHQLTSFEFLVSFSITMRIFSSMRSLTVNLQKIFSLHNYEHVADVQLELEQLKTNCDHLWYEEIVEFAAHLGVPVSIPRIASRQVHRANVPADSPEVYYRRNHSWIMWPLKWKPDLDQFTRQKSSSFVSYLLILFFVHLLPSRMSGSRLTITSTALHRDE